MQETLKSASGEGFRRSLHKPLPWNDRHRQADGSAENRCDVSLRHRGLTMPIDN